jgi:hypothetical protein
VRLANLRPRSGLAGRLILSSRTKGEELAQGVLMPAESEVWVGSRISKSDHMRFRKRLKDARTNATVWIREVILRELDREGAGRAPQLHTTADVHGK